MKDINLISSDMLINWVEFMAKEFESKKDYLTELDSAIGDADHGINMNRGFTAALKELQDKKPVNTGDIMKSVSMSLIKNVGGASGPLYGTLFMKLGVLQSKEVPLNDFVSALDEGIKGMEKLGKSSEGEKTMLDVWHPVLRSLKNSTEHNVPLHEAFHEAEKIALNAEEATKNIAATKGRASYMGDRSIGHIDPGAASSLIIIEQAAKAFV